MCPRPGGCGRGLSKGESLAVRKNGARWTVEFMQRGIRIFRRLPEGRTKADAKQLESRLRNQIFGAYIHDSLPFVGKLR